MSRSAKSPRLIVTVSLSERKVIVSTSRHPALSRISHHLVGYGVAHGQCGALRYGAAGAAPVRTARTRAAETVTEHMEVSSGGEEAMTVPGDCVSAAAIAGVWEVVLNIARLYGSFTVPDFEI